MNWRQPQQLFEVMNCQGIHLTVGSMFSPPSGLWSLWAYTNSEESIFTPFSVIWETVHCWIGGSLSKHLKSWSVRTYLNCWIPAFHHHQCSVGDNTLLIWRQPQQLSEVMNRQGIYLTVGSLLFITIRALMLTKLYKFWGECFCPFSSNLGDSILSNRRQPHQPFEVMNCQGIYSYWCSLPFTTISSLKTCDYFLNDRRYGGIWAQSDLYPWTGKSKESKVMNCLC